MPIIEFDEGQPGAKGSFSWGEDLKPEADENAQLLAWWHALSRDRGCPQFPEVDLLEQPEIIPRLSIVECQRDRDCFVIKMMGSEIVSTYGKDRREKRFPRIARTLRMYLLTRLFRQSLIWLARL